MNKYLFTFVLFALFRLNPAFADTLSDIKKTGYIKCGVSTGLNGFSKADEKGHWKGLDVDLCRAVAAATLGDAQKVKFYPLSAKERFTALQSGEIDILSRNTTWTFSRDTTLGLNFAGIIYYDGQGFMLKKDLDISDTKALNGLSVCLKQGTTSELNLIDFYKKNNMKYKAISFDTSEQIIKGFASGRCDMVTSDRSQLYSMRLTLDNPDSAIILADVISKEPLGPVVRDNDDNWLNIVKWTIYTLLNAEELGISRENIKKLKENPEPSMQRLLNASGKKLGLGKTWSYDIISQVGNYADIFEANIGKRSPLRIERGLNALWSKGGLQYAPPMR